MGFRLANICFEQYALSVRSVATSRSGALSVLTPRTRRVMLLGIAPDAPPLKWSDLRYVCAPFRVSSCELPLFCAASNESRATDAALDHSLRLENYLPTVAPS